MKGKVLLVLADPDIDGAERCFSHSLDLARSQTARAWELHTAVDWAALRAERQSTAPARDLLQPIVDGFAEGFDTADLHAAHRLLVNLPG